MPRRPWTWAALVVASLLASFLMTQRWLSWGGAIRYLGEGDVLSYEPMAKAAPGLPTDRIGAAYTARFPVHYMVGLLADGTPLTVRGTYAAAAGACIATVLWLAWSSMRHLRVALPWRVVLLAVLLLNAYAFRYYVMAPGMLADLVFVVGLATSVHGVFTRRNGMLFVGAVLAACSRQTAMLALPVLAVWSILAARNDPDRRSRGVVAALVATAPFVTGVAVSAITKPFTSPFGLRIPEDTILPLLADLPSTLPELGTHAMRVAIPFPLPLVVLGAVVLGRLRLGAGLGVHFWGLLAVSAAVVAQPLGVSDDYPGFAFNEPRLSALGLFPTVLAIAVLVADTRLSIGSGRALAVLAAVAIASLHHLYTVVGPASLSQFVATQLVMAATVGVLVFRVARGGDRPTAADDRTHEGTTA